MKKFVIDERLRETFKIIGTNIIRFRGGMTKEKLAEKASISRQTILTIEKGEPINLGSLIKIADALGVKPADLFITNEQRKDVSYMHILLWEKLSESLGMKPKK